MNRPEADTDMSKGDEVGSSLYDAFVATTFDCTATESDGLASESVTPNHISVTPSDIYLESNLSIQIGLQLCMGDERDSKCSMINMECDTMRATEGSLVG